MPELFSCIFLVFNQTYYDMKRKNLLMLFLFCSLSLFSQEILQNKVLVSADVGVGFLVGNSNLSPVSPNYRNEYKNGISADLKVLYLLNKRIGLGVKYNYWGTSGKYELVDVYTNYKDNVSLHYIAPQFELITPLTNNFNVISTVGAGYMHYKNKTNLLKWKANTNSFAANIDIMFEYKITKRFSARVGASYLIGNGFKNMKQTVDDSESSITWEKERRIKVHRIDCLIGIVGHF